MRQAGIIGMGEAVTFINPLPQYRAEPDDVRRGQAGEVLVNFLWLDNRIEIAAIGNVESECASQFRTVHLEAAGVQE